MTNVDYSVIYKSKENELISTIYAGKKNQRWFIDMITQLGKINAEYAAKLNAMVQRATIPYPEFLQLNHQNLLLFIHNAAHNASELSSELEKFAVEAEQQRKLISTQVKQVLKQFNKEVQ